MSAKVSQFASVSDSDTITLVSGTKAEILASQPAGFALGNPTDSQVPMLRAPGGEWVEGSGGGTSVTLTAPTVTESSPESAYKQRVTRGDVVGVGATLVTWDLSYRIIGDPDWTEYATDIPAATLYRDVSDLTPETDYEFLTTGTGTIAYTTAPSIGAGTTIPVPPAPVGATELIVFTGLHTTDETNADTQAYALRVINKGASPITSMQIEGYTRRASSAAILGAVIGSGTINTTTYSASTWQQATRNGQQAWTPASGSAAGSYWLSDEIQLTNPIPANGSAIVRVVVGAGGVSVPRYAPGSSRFHIGDVVAAKAATSGDYGSTPSQAAVNPTWTANTNLPMFGVRVNRGADTQAQIAGVFGDSIALGEMGFIYYDYWLKAANDALTGGRKVVTFGVGSQTTEQYCKNFLDWMANNPGQLSLIRSIGIMGISWNGGGAAAVDAAMAAGVAAGLRMWIYIPTPSGLVQGAKGNHADWLARRAYYVAQGYTIVDTSPAVTDVDGASIIPAYTVEGVHLNAAGQAIQGAQFAANQATIFG